MAGEEPPYLTVGTDVSAKYKGAFCEAKIKKVTRSVKCRVNFKNSMGTLVVTDDLVRGTLRVGAHVEAKHPEKNQYLEGVINKLHDYSQYTVVFDDGDETTLRRTSLCLKSGRHFAESETLDQLPLTHPEHFGTPVMGSKGRKRRILHRSLIVGDGSSDEETIVRKKGSKPKESDPDMGKAVCVELGDKKKKDNWVPAVIVSHSAQDNVKTKNKEECIIRSFKDGKYHVVVKKETKEFTRDVASKMDSSALKSAVEKALLYLEEDQLPSSWDRELLFGTDGSGSRENSDQDTDSDSSDDEQSEEKDRFVAQLYKFMDDRGTPINKAPTVSNRDLNLYKLFKIVQKLGGYNRTTNQMHWKMVYTKLGLPTYNSSSSHQIKQAYKKYLHSFEDFYRKLGCTMGTSTRSGRVRHRSGRNLMLPRDRERRDRDLKAAGRRALKQKEKEEEKAKALAEEEKQKAKDEESSKEEPENRKHESKVKAAVGKSDTIPRDVPEIAAKGSTDDKDRKPGTSKVEKKLDVENDSDADHRRAMREIRVKLEKEDSESEDDNTEREDSRCRGSSRRDKNDDSSSPRRRGRKKKSKKGDEKSHDSDDEDAETRRNVLVNTDDRVKVKYGRGRQQKIYEAKVLKVDEEEGDRIYFVHYTGWNMRYDEWVKRHRIVENLTQRTIGKRTRLAALAKCSKPPGKRGRPQGSTSLKSLGPPGSKGGLRSRSTRSDRSSLESFPNGLGPKRRTRRSSGTQESGQGTTGDSSDDCDSESIESEIMEQMERRMTRFSKKGASMEDLDTSIEEDNDKSETPGDDEDTQNDDFNESPCETSTETPKFKESPPSTGKSYSRKDRSSKERTDESATANTGTEEEKSPRTKKLQKSKAKIVDSDAEDDASGEEDTPKTKPPPKRTRGRPTKASLDSKEVKESPSKAKLKEKKAKPKNKKGTEDKDQSDEEETDDKTEAKVPIPLKEAPLLSKFLLADVQQLHKEHLPAYESDHQYSDPLREFPEARSILFSEMMKPIDQDIADIAAKSDHTDAISVFEETSNSGVHQLSMDMDLMMSDDVLKEDMDIVAALKITDMDEASVAPSLEKIVPLEEMKRSTPAPNAEEQDDEQAPKLVQAVDVQPVSKEQSSAKASTNIASTSQETTVIVSKNCEKLFDSLLVADNPPSDKEKMDKIAKETDFFSCDVCDVASNADALDVVPNISKIEEPVPAIEHKLVEPTTFPSGRAEPTLPPGKAEPTLTPGSAEPTLPPGRVEPTLPPRRAEPTLPPGRVESVLPPGKEEPMSPPRKAEPMSPPRKAEPALVPRKAEPALVPRKVEPTLPSRKVEPTLPPRKVEPTLPPRKVDADSDTVPNVFFLEALPAVEVKVDTAVPRAPSPAGISHEIQVQASKMPAKSVEPVTETLPASIVEEEKQKMESVTEVVSVKKPTPTAEEVKESTIPVEEPVTKESLAVAESAGVVDTRSNMAILEDVIISKIAAIQDGEEDERESSAMAPSEANVSKGSKSKRRQKNKKPEKRKVVSGDGESSDDGSTEDEPKVKKKKNREDKVDKSSKGDMKVKKSREKRGKSKKGDGNEDKEESRAQKKKSTLWKSRRKECKKKKESLEKSRKDKEEARFGLDSDDTSSVSSAEGGQRKKSKKSRKHKGDKGPDSERKKSRKSKAVVLESEEQTSEDSNREAKKSRKEEKAKPKRKKEKSKKEVHSSEDSDGSKISITASVFQEKEDLGPVKAEVAVETKVVDRVVDDGAGDISSYLICEEKVPASPTPEDMDGLNDTAVVKAPAVTQELKEVTASTAIPTSSGISMPHQVSNVTSFAPLNLRPKLESESSTVLDNTPPTTPESSGTNISESPPHHGRGSPLASPLHDMDSGITGTSGEKSSQSSSPNVYATSFEQHYGLHTKCDLDLAEEVIGGSSKDKMAHLAAMVPKRVRLEFDDGSSSRKKKKSHRKQLSPSDPNKMAGSSAGSRHRHGTSKISKGSDDSEDVLQGCSDNAVGAPPSLGSPYHQMTSTLLETQVAPRSPRPSRFNFFVELDDYSDGAERIAVLQEKLTELRRTYLALKAEVACIDRRRKKLKRKEKEATSSSTPSSASVVVECS